MNVTEREGSDGRLDFISYLHLSKSNLISVSESPSLEKFDYVSRQGVLDSS